MSKARWFYTYRSTFKGLLFVFALLIIITQVWYTQKIVSSLRKDQQELVKTYAKLYQLVAESDASADFSFLLENVILQITIPVILTSPDGEPSYHTIEGIDEKNPPFSSETIKQLEAMINTMDKENPPIPVNYETTVLTYLHFGDSEMIRLLSWLPAIEVSILSLFILLAFVGFNNIRRSEQRFIWVGMAKETAHQLGTPISSLIGWLEVLKDSTTQDKTREVTGEMSRDLKRLTKVAQRFSQIGSNSDITFQDIVPVLNDIAGYFRKRLPQTGKSIKIHEIYPAEAVCRINLDLFEWALENLIKNALDAIENGKGEVTIKLEKLKDTENFSLDIIDSGKGIAKQLQKEIFKPGFSTKKRGWGLGLSLAKRIVEDYHGGKLQLKQSKPDEGTTMRIILKGGNPNGG